MNLSKLNISLLLAAIALNGCATVKKGNSTELTSNDEDAPDMSMPFVKVPGSDSETLRQDVRAKLRKIRFEAKTAEERRAHIRELLGKQYKKAIATVEDPAEVSAQVLEWTRESLKGTHWAKKSDLVARAILDESQRYGYDPVFLMAVIRNESQFKPDARGSAGEIGLMQIMPKTGRWVCKLMGWKYRGDKKTLGDPIMNIRIGSAYLSMLRRQFDSKGRLYLAAYNMGSTNVRRAVARKITPKDYSNRVLQFYLSYYKELRLASN